MLNNNDKDINSLHTHALQDRVLNSGSQQIIIVCHHPEHHVQKGETDSGDKSKSKPDKKRSFSLGFITAKLLDLIDYILKIITRTS